MRRGDAKNEALVARSGAGERAVGGQGRYDVSEITRWLRDHQKTALHAVAGVWMGCAHGVEGDEGGRRKRRLSERLAGDDNKGGRARNS